MSAVGIIRTGIVRAGSLGSALQVAANKGNCYCGPQGGAIK